MSLYIGGLIIGMGYLHLRFGGLSFRRAYFWGWVLIFRISQTRIANYLLLEVLTGLHYKTKTANENIKTA